MDMLSSRATWPWQHHLLFRKLEALLRHSDFHLTHVFQEANVVADGLSKLASSSQNDFSFTSVTLPQNIRGLVVLDRVSFPYVRM